jgi:hypothetical protein
MYRMPAALSSGLAGMDLGALGIPSEQDYVAAYCRRTGRDGLPNVDYLVVFCLFRLAAIIHGIKGTIGARQRLLGPCGANGRAIGAACGARLDPGRGRTPLASPGGTGLSRKLAFFLIRG